ncbi:type II secretion system F family protein [Aeoliella mucimassa]|uniref:Type II secretion system protein F n=1 Tax=Aeoliella mucimassa TaxID=2527972 RepID=A0A518AM10_9BACT|nr:type II secretion system F family protein [Aeoliella mucimassa]QDU55738.1 Type II secretion system protein F [Aeoliella mucimassa]
MLFSPHISGKRLSELCHHMAVGLSAGVDIRKVWQRETETASRRVRHDYERVLRRIKAGDSFAEAIRQTGGLFPSLFIEMVDVGERTGQIAEVLDKLSHHYKQRHELTRGFLVMLFWPLLQLGAGVMIIGLLIWILGAIGAKKMSGEPMDVLGLGLTGFWGMITFFSIVALFAVGVLVLVQATRRGVFWGPPLQRFVTRLPGIGKAIQTLGLARISWTLHLLLNVEMDMRKLVPLVLRSTGNDFYICHTDQMVADVAAGNPLYLAFANSLAFPPSFLDALAVAEESGQISRSMERLASQYEAEAESAMKIIAVISGVAIWICIGALLVYMIFRLFFVLYLGPIQEMLNA